MRFFVSILVVLNVATWIFFNQENFYTGGNHGKHPEINAEKLHLLNPHQLSTLPRIDVITKPEVSSSVNINVISTANAVEMQKVDEPAKPVENTKIAAKAETATVSTKQCYEWGVFTDANMANGQRTLSKLSLESKLKEHSSTATKRYWVYLPPLPSAELAQQKATELKALGIDDLFILQNEKWKNAISFGVFEDGDLAQKLLEDIQSKGVANAVKTLRNQGNGQYSFLIQAVNEMKVNQLKEIKSDFPSTNLKKINCIL